MALCASPRYEEAFCPKAKNGLDQLAPSALPHYHSISASYKTYRYLPERAPRFYSLLSQSSLTITFKIPFLLASQSSHLKHAIAFPFFFNICLLVFLSFSCFFKLLGERFPTRARSEHTLDNSSFPATRSKSGRGAYFSRSW